MVGPVYYKQKLLPISMSINLIVVFLVFSACSPTSSSSPSPSGRLVVVGSTALQPLTTLAAKQFEKENPQAHVEVSGGGSLFGLDAVTGQKADIGESDVYADPALYPDPNLTDHIVCIVPFTMIVNPDVSLSSLKQQQIADIFTNGTPHNWSDLGGPDLSIVPVIRTDMSGTRASFLKYVLNGEDVQDNLLQTDSSTTMLKAVATTPGAIGYIAIPALNANANAGVHTLAINGQTATAKAIISGKYAFWGYEHMYTMSNSRNAILPVFLQFMVTSTIQNQAQRMGYIPLTGIPLSIPTANAQ